MTKFWFSVLCLALAATSVIRCDSDSSSDNSSDGNGANGDSGVEDSVACSAIAQYLSGDVTAPADQSQLLDSFFNDFNSDLQAFVLQNLPKLIVSNDFSFGITVLRCNFESFQNFIGSSDVQQILGDFFTAFESVVQTVEMISEADDIDRPMIKRRVVQLLTDFLDAIEPCELDRYNRKIRNLFETDIFGQLVAIAECNAGFNVFGGLVAAANATQGFFPDILEILGGFVPITPFITGENYIRTLVPTIVAPYFFKFTSREEAAVVVNDAFLAFIDTDDICGVALGESDIEFFNFLYNEQYLDFIAAKII